jgi:hypothetical protein
MDHSFNTVMQAAAELPRTVSPLLEYAQVIQPDAIIVCDRDARPLGYAFEQLAANDERFAHLQEKLWYRRVSKKLARDAIALHCEPIYAGLREIDRPKIMVIDDHISRRGTTANLFRAATSLAGLQHASIHWTTLTGKGTALNLKPFASPALEAPWRDRPEILGIDYEGTEFIETPTEQSVAFYAAIANAAHNVAA